MMFHRDIAARLSKPCRDLLIEHIDGGAYVEAPVTVHLSGRYRSMTALMAIGLIRFTNYGERPQATRITDHGRVVLGLVLASYAEALARAATRRDQNEIARAQRTATAGAQAAEPEATIIPGSSPTETRLKKSRSSVGGRQTTLMSADPSDLTESTSASQKSPVMAR